MVQIKKKPPASQSSLILAEISRPHDHFRHRLYGLRFLLSAACLRVVLLLIAAPSDGLVGAKRVPGSFSILFFLQYFWWQEI